MRGAIMLLIAGTAACGETTAPERHSLLGRWRSDAASGAAIEMVISETARTVSGAGRWIEADTALAFAVSGTNTGESVSLIFDFGDSPLLNFLGVFVDEETLEGTIVGRGDAPRPARFLKVDEDD